MIAEGDKILVGLSGGMDSLALMWILTEIRRYAPVAYEVIGAHIDPGFENGFSHELESYCHQMGYTVCIEKTDYGVTAHSEQNRENPCFLCSRLRRKRLFEIAKEMGAKKLAFGHHKDDIIETFFINVLYAGEISTMVPSQSFFKGEFTVIRPLAFAEKNVIKRFARQHNLPVFVNPCPSSETSKRKEIRTILDQLYKTNRKIKGNIFRALHHVNQDYLL